MRGARCRAWPRVGTIRKCGGFLRTAAIQPCRTTMVLMAVRCIRGEGPTRDHLSSGWASRYFLEESIAMLRVFVVGRTTRPKRPVRHAEGSDLGLAAVRAWEDRGHWLLLKQGIHCRERQIDPVEDGSSMEEGGRWAQTSPVVQTPVAFAAGSVNLDGQVVQPAERDRDHTQPFPPSPSRRLKSR